VSLEIATLLGHSQLDLAVRCLGSLAASACEPVQLRVHDDGTLRKDDETRLRDLLPVARVVSREEADDLASRALRGLPFLASLRSRNVLALKLTDSVGFESSSRLVFVDSDVLFLRRFRLPHLMVEGDDCVFFPDLQSAYSLRPAALLRRRATELPARINTGFFSIPTARVDLAVADRFLGSWTGYAAPWIEQTCWALIAGVAGTHTLDPQQMRIPLSGLISDSETVALHFVSPTRGRIAELGAPPPDPLSAEPVLLRTRPARKLTAVELMADAVRRRVRSVSGS
jgi:hypothetical protein